MKKLNKEEIEFIKNLSKEMKEQSTRCTAQPYGLILLQEVDEVRPSGFCDNLIAVHDCEQYETFEELTDSLFDYYGQDDENVVELIEVHNSLYSLQDSNVADELNIEVFNIERTNVPVKMSSNFFITEKAYHAYIKRDGHNLTKPSSFGIHLTRNSEMEKLYDVIHKIAEGL